MGGIGGYTCTGAGTNILKDSQVLNKDSCYSVIFDKV